jgi:hypothetical protein
MAALETDTLFYRWDHPNGFMFSAGNEAPAEADGWRASAVGLPDGPPVTYECTTLAAFQALLDSERAGAATTAASLKASLAQAHAAIALQADIIVGLEAEIAALSPQEG